MLEIKEITDKKIWDAILVSEKIGFYPFFQSWNWGEVQKKLRRKILRIGIYDRSQLIGVCLIVEVKAKRGHYFHLRHGPVLLKYNEEYLTKIIEFIKEEAKKIGVSFIRISPLINKEVENSSLFRNFINAPIHNMDAETCWILDITKPEDQLLKEMRKTHRYLIRKAQGMDIKIIRTKKLSEMNSFLIIYNNLAKRKGFIPHNDIKEEFEVLSDNDEALLLLAYYKNKIISVVFLVFAGDMAIYHHGASLDEYREIPASYLLQWESILEAKKRGKKLYNFWGIVPLDKPNHPWKGITLFKTGFGGQRVEFIHAKDFPFNFLYWKTFLIESLTKLKKGY